MAHLEPFSKDRLAASPMRVVFFFLSFVASTSDRWPVPSFFSFLDSFPAMLRWRGAQLH